MIPDLPTKEETLEKPNNNEKFDLLDALDDKIDDVYKEKKKFFKELKRQNKSLNDISDINLLKDQRKDVRKKLDKGFEKRNVHEKEKK